MRAPPPVEYTSQLGLAWRGALSGLVAASVAAPLAWGLPFLASYRGTLWPDAFFGLIAQPSAQGGLAAGFGAMAFAASWLACRRSTGDRTLRWDGEDWLLPGTANGAPEQRGEASLMLDLGPWMLVRFRPHAGAPSGRSTWLPFHLVGHPGRWAALRCALWTWRGSMDTPGR